MKNQFANPKRFNGAWLTDVDDTLIKSGITPSDEWVTQLSQFLEVLKQHNILWAAVSGVSIIKMGPRLLYRLPESVLSHVAYFGGEGSTRHSYNFAEKNWQSVAAFQRDVSDAQALLLIGEAKFKAYLKESLQLSSVDGDPIISRIAAAQQILKEKQFDKTPTIVEKMNASLERAGYSAQDSAAYFRGGAFSWMMLGDISVNHYKGGKETHVRNTIAEEIRTFLEQHNGFSSLGEASIHMPYPHATRGIKLVLQGNDKSRAAENLVRTEGIVADKILFTGNEIYPGGNDLSVQNIADVTLLSVGAKEAPGVINGGLQTQANQYWMDKVSQHLSNKQDWKDILRSLPKWAGEWQLTQEMRLQKTYCQKECGCASTLSELLDSDLPERLVHKYRKPLIVTRKTLIKLNEIRYGLVSRLAMLETNNYDQARSNVQTLLNSAKNPQQLTEKLETNLCSELNLILQKLYIDQLEIKRKKVKHYLGQAKTPETLLKKSRMLLEKINRFDINIAEEVYRTATLIDHWKKEIRKTANNWFRRMENWQQAAQQETDLIYSDKDFPQSDQDKQSLHRLLQCLLFRAENIPHLKDLDKPTIVLISGTSGVGKSAISRHISKSLGIPTSVSSDVASRSVMRRTIKFIVGDDAAENLFPELYSSSFSGDSLEWFYAHAMLTMVGVGGNIDRLIKENLSAVIDGVALIPGTLPDIYFEKANIVWIVVRVKNKKTHYERLNTRDESGLERGGADKYQKQFKTIRKNHNRLVKMGKKLEIQVVDNSGKLDSTLESVLNRVEDPFSDRGKTIKDSLRGQTKAMLEERISLEIHDLIRHKEALSGVKYL